MKEQTGLVLEGGGVRGIYTAGVLDVFLEESLTFDGVIGVSPGRCTAALIYRDRRAAASVISASM